MTKVRPVLDIPIFHKIYDLYKLLHTIHNKIPKAERYTLWQKCENTTLGLLETLIEISYQKGEQRIQTLYMISNLSFGFFSLIYRIFRSSCELFLLTNSNEAIGFGEKIAI